MIRVLMYLGAVILTLWALLDIAQTPAGQVQLLPRAGWALVALVPGLGPLAWFLLGRAPVTAGPRATGRPGGPLPRGGSTRAPGPIGPDDDPDFLRQLGRRRPDGPK